MSTPPTESEQARKYSLMFSPMRLGGLELRNRLVALPLYTGYAHPGGRVSALLQEHYWQLAKSGSGLVVVESAAVSADGVTSPSTIRADADEFLPGLSRLARAIHSGGAKACLQLNHAGRYAWTSRPLLPAAMDASHLAFDIAALKAFMESFPFERRFGLTRLVMARAAAWQRGMSQEERERVISDFGCAAARAAEAGFDMVELHGATGYLISQFLSSHTNPPGSLFSGDLPTRARFVLDILQEIRRNLPANFPIGYRLMLREWVPDGVDMEESLALARMLEQEGVCYLSATAGTYISFFLPQVRAHTVKPGYLAQDMTLLKQQVDVPVIVAGKILAPALAEKLLCQGAADLIGLARPLLADQQWVRKAETGGRIRACIDCNYCLKQVVQNQGVGCVRWTEIETQRIRLELAMLKRRAYHALLMVTSRSDLRLLRYFWQTRTPARDDISATICVLRSLGLDGDFERELAEFTAWGQKMWSQRRAVEGSLELVELDAGDAPEQVVLQEARRRDCGVVVLARTPLEPWREQVASRFRGGVLSLLGSRPNQSAVLVPVDLSDATPLLLRYIAHAYHGKSGFSFTFVHVQEDARNQSQQRWRQLLQLLGWDEETPLTLLPASGRSGQAILRMIDQDGFGQVLMGRRGMSGLKRLFLGSVSAEVMRGLSDQSLTLVDS